MKHYILALWVLLLPFLMGALFALLILFAASLLNPVSWTAYRAEAGAFLKRVRGWRRTGRPKQHA